VWIPDNELRVTAELDNELWRRYVDLRADVETTLEGLGMMRNGLSAGLSACSDGRR
jgi:hypothetical protein